MSTNIFEKCDKESNLQDKFAGNTQYDKNQFESDNSTLLPSLLEQHGTDYEAEAFARQKEAEEKKRRRMRFKGF